MLCFIFLIVGFLPSLIYSHGSIRDPPSRNVIANSNGCPDCLSAGGLSVVYQNVRSKARYGVCGDPWNARKDHEAGGKFARGVITRTYESGSVIPIKLSFSTNHMGRLSFGICDLPDKKLSMASERLLTTQSCFGKNVLKRVDTGGIYSFLNGKERSVIFKYRLPRSLKCKHCVLQMHWQTGNSCCPSNTHPRFCENGVSRCFLYAVPEEWWNCSDIRIT